MTNIIHDTVECKLSVSPTLPQYSMLFQMGMVYVGVNPNCKKCQEEHENTNDHNNNEGGSQTIADVIRITTGINYRAENKKHKGATKPVPDGKSQSTPRPHKNDIKIDL